MAPTPRPTDSSGPIKSICKRYPRSQALAYLLSHISKVPYPHKNFRKYFDERPHSSFETHGTFPFAQGI